MKSTILTLLLSTTLLLAAGCSEEQLAKVDKGLADANEVHGQADQVLDALRASPAGPLIPAAVYQIMELLGIGLTAAVALWKTLVASGLLQKNQTLAGKNEDLVTTLKALVDGVEASGEKAKPVKLSIKEIMRDREVYSVANPIVDQVKAMPVQKNS